jgi:TolA-binding protein
MKVLHKKDLRGDEFQDSVESVYEFWIRYGRKYLWPAVGVLVLASGAYAAWLYMDKQERHASFMLGDAFTYYSKTDATGQHTGEDAEIARQKFQDLVDEHPRSRAALLARWILVSMSMAKLDYAAAQPELEEFAKRHDSYGVLARYSLASLYVSQKRYDEARGLLEGLLNTEDKTILAPETLHLALARVFREEGNHAKAAEHYQVVTSEYPNTESAESAADEMKAIQAPQTEQDS